MLAAWRPPASASGDQTLQIGGGLFEVRRDDARVGAGAVASVDGDVHEARQTGGDVQDRAVGRMGVHVGDGGIDLLRVGLIQEELHIPALRRHDLGAASAHRHFVDRLIDEGELIARQRLSGPFSSAIAATVEATL